MRRELPFNKERVQLATRGYYRIGHTPDITIGKSKAQVLKYERNSKTTYNVCISKENGWTWFYDVTLKKVYQILDNADRIAMFNEV